MLHAVIREHLEPFLRDVSAHSDGSGLPLFVEQEFRAFLGCGVLAEGFTRLRCPECAFATVHNPAVVRAILTPLGAAPGSDSPGPAPPHLDHTAATG